jgi:hypothetical protein
MPPSYVLSPSPYVSTGIAEEKLFRSASLREGYFLKESLNIE